jgi:histidinol-phosphate/aromatic aminotransferase/cobyric acid decarboxylase-like protein
MSHFWSPAVHRLTPYIPGEQPKHRRYVRISIGTDDECSQLVRALERIVHG